MSHTTPNRYASKSELLEWINGLLQLQLGRWVVKQLQGDNLMVHSSINASIMHEASYIELLLTAPGASCPPAGRLEQFSSGAVFCQMLDAYFSEAIPMHKVGI